MGGDYSSSFSFSSSSSSSPANWNLINSNHRLHPLNDRPPVAYGLGGSGQSRASLFDFDAVVPSLSPSFVIGSGDAPLGGGRRFGAGSVRARGGGTGVGKMRKRSTRRAAAARGGYAVNSNNEGQQAIASTSIVDATMQAEANGHNDEEEDDALEGDDEEYIQSNDMEDDKDALSEVEEEDEEYTTSRANQSTSRSSRRGKASSAPRKASRRTSTQGLAQAAPSGSSTAPVLNTAGSNVAASGKAFQCSGFGECRMVFSRSEHLARHIRKHTGERPFKCRCGRSFSRLDNLRQHSQTVHHDQPDQNAEMLESLSLVHSSLSVRASLAHKAVKAPVSSSSSGSASTSSQQHGAPPRKKHSFSVQSIYTSSSSPAGTSGSSGATARGHPVPPVYQQAPLVAAPTRASTRLSAAPPSSTGSRTKRRINPEAYREHPYPARSSSSDTSNASLSPVTPLARLPTLPQLLPEHYEEMDGGRPYAFSDEHFPQTSNQESMYLSQHRYVSRGGLPSIDALITVTNAESDRLYPSSFPPTDYGGNSAPYLSVKTEWDSSDRPFTTASEGLYYDPRHHFSDQKLYPHQQERPHPYHISLYSQPELYTFTTGRSKSLPDYRRNNKGRGISFSPSDAARDSSEERMDYQSGDSAPAISLSTTNTDDSSAVEQPPLTPTQQYQKARPVRSLPNMRIRVDSNVVLPPPGLSPHRQMVKPSLGQSPLYTRAASPRPARSPTPYAPINWNHHSNTSSQATIKPSTTTTAGNLSPPLSASRRTISAERSTSQIAALVQGEERGLRASSSDDMAETASLMSLSRLCSDETRMETPELEAAAASTMTTRKRAREDDDEDEEGGGEETSAPNHAKEDAPQPRLPSPAIANQQYLYPHLQQRPPHSPSLLQQRLVHQ